MILSVEITPLFYINPSHVCPLLIIKMLIIVFCYAFLHSKRSSGARWFPVEGQLADLIVTPLCSHLHPYGVMAEEASDLPPGEDTTGVRVLVVRHHLYSQRLQLRSVESPDREGGVEEKLRHAFSYTCYRLQGAKSRH